MLKFHWLTRASTRQLVLGALALSAAAACPLSRATISDGLAISGSPPKSATVGQSYSFTPTVSDPTKRPLTFAIQNKPAWATFSTSTGKLWGTPTAAYAGAVYNEVEIIAKDGVAQAALIFSLKVTAGATADKPVISGTPATSVAAGNTYAFQPSAKDPEGKTLSFSVQNKPAWATFSIASGLLDGKPSSTQTGTYANIVISASNGTYSTPLPAFSITVNNSVTSTSTGSATLTWTAPTENTNGTALTDLVGYRIYYGTSPASLSHVVELSSPGETSYTIGDLAAGIWYFAAAAYTSVGTQSALSSIVSKSIP